MDLEDLLVEPPGLFIDDLIERVDFVDNGLMAISMRIVLPGLHPEFVVVRNVLLEDRLAHQSIRGFLE